MHDREWTSTASPLSHFQRRLLKPQTLVSFGSPSLLWRFIIYRMDINLCAVWANIKAADARLFLLAACALLPDLCRPNAALAVHAESGRDQRSRLQVPSNTDLFQILMLSWFANCIVPAKLGDGYRCYLMKQDSGAPGSMSLGTILAERMIDLAVLFVTMTITGFVAFHGNLPDKVEHTVSSVAV